jgi:hypothetical protein
LNVNHSGKEDILGRVINPESAGKERNQLVRAVVLALRELMRQAEPNREAHDIAAFIVIALDEINGTIDASVAAWEKRGYWVKADRFRMDWSWAEHLGPKMRQALLAEDWGNVAGISVQIAQKLGDVKVPQRTRLGEPWVGAWERLKTR